MMTGRGTGTGIGTTTPTPSRAGVAVATIVGVGRGRIGIAPALYRPIYTVTCTRPSGTLPTCWRTPRTNSSAFTATRKSETTKTRMNGSQAEMSGRQDPIENRETLLPRPNLPRIPYPKDSLSWSPDPRSGRGFFLRPGFRRMSSAHVFAGLTMPNILSGPGNRLRSPR